MKVTANDSRHRGPSGVTAFRTAVIFVLVAVILGVAGVLYYAHLKSRISGTAQDLFYAGTNYYLDRVGDGELPGASRGINGEWILIDPKVLTEYYDKPLPGEMRLCIDETDRKVIEAEYKESFWFFTLHAVYPEEN